ncbi:hypothetical protein VNO78_10853 [Psophocarpus tetragonolobus]|uniref:GATA-type domain-containing protein n=1 Tax=Psophocarpus tetragonolobus TaxID=3891 RepID=A0AAN9SKF5_PSOTE
MGRKCGPCFHWGIHFTPLWRTGPESKPVLCNACGSRYRKCGSLEDYLPNHCQPKYLDNRGKYRRLWNPKIPSRRRSPVVYKKMTPMKRFQIQLLKMWKIYGNQDESSTQVVLLSNNVNNFIPSDEIGLGCALLKPDATSS